MQTNTPTQMVLCKECGKHEHHDFNDRCHHCHNRAVEEHRAARRAQLDAMPRCELCNRRGAWELSGALLCGHHKKRVQQGREQQLGKSGSLALVAGLTAQPLSRDDVLRLAR